MTRLVHIADLHFGDEDEALVDDFLSGLPELKPDVVVVAGDLTQTGSRKEFDTAAAFLAAIDVPVVLTPGNHDTPLLNLGARLTRPWRRLEKAFHTLASPRFKNSETHIESFNSARGAQLRLDWSLGVVSHRHLQPALDALQTGGGTHRILTAHHPIISPLENRGRARTKRSKVFVEPIASVADLVLTGHLHTFFKCPVQHDDRLCWFVGASTAFSSRTREEAAGFNLIELGSAALKLDRYEAIDSGFTMTEQHDLYRVAARS